MFSKPIKNNDWKYNSQFSSSNFDSPLISDPMSITSHDAYLNGRTNQFTSNQFSTVNHLTTNHLSSNHLTPNHLTQNHLTSNQLTPSHLTPNHLTPNHLTSNHLTPNHLTPNHLAPNHLTGNHLTSNQFSCNQFSNNHTSLANPYSSMESNTYSPLPSPPSLNNLDNNSSHFTNQLNNQFNSQFKTQFNNQFSLPFNHHSHLNTLHNGVNSSNNLYTNTNASSDPMSLTPPSDSPPSSSSNFNSSDLLLRDDEDDDTATVISNAESMNHHFSFDLMAKIHYNGSNLQPQPGKTRTRDKYRVVYSDTQRVELESEYHCSKYITIGRKSELAKKLNLSERQVKIWFQNRRAKERKEAKKQPTFISQF